MQRGNAAQLPASPPDKPGQVTAFGQGHRYSVRRSGAVDARWGTAVEAVDRVRELLMHHVDNRFDVDAGGHVVDEPHEGGHAEQGQEQRKRDAEMRHER